MQVASQLARGSGFDCITLQGDQVNRKGALTGGYVEQHGKIQAQRFVNELRQQLYDSDEEIARVQHEVKRVGCPIILAVIDSFLAQSN